MRARSLVLLALLAPTASALDVFPANAQYGDTEARVLVRLPNGGALRIAAEPPVDVAVVTPGARPAAFGRTPVAAVVEALSPRDSWHGLPGTVEVVARRGDLAQAVCLVVDDGTGAGAEIEWPVVDRGVPAPGIVLVACVALAALARRR